MSTNGEDGGGTITPPAGWIDDLMTTAEDIGCDCCGISASAVKFHRVHIELGSNLDVVRIQVRGINPCCIMRSVIDFIDFYLNDFLPLTQHVVMNAPPPPYSSLNIETASCTSSSTVRAEPSPASATINGLLSSAVRSSRNRQNGSGICNYTASNLSRLTSRCASKASVRCAGIGGNGGGGGNVGGCGGLSPSDICDFDDDGDDDAGSGDQLQSDDDLDEGVDERRRLYVVCPKCILLRHANPERIEYPKRHVITSSSMSASARRRKPICSKWHNLGSWARVVTGDYRPTLRGLGAEGGGSTTVGATPSITPAALSSNGLYLGGAALPDHEHPRLVLVLPPGERLSTIDWYVFSRTRFIDGFDIHFLCEYTGYWHFVNDGGVEFRLGGGVGGQVPSSAASVPLASAQPSAYRGRRAGCPGAEHPLPAALLKLAIPLIQCLRGVDEHAVNVRMLAPIVGDLLDAYDSSGTTSGSNNLTAHSQHRGDPSGWLIKHRDKLVSMLTKVLIGAFHSETNLSSAAVAAEVYSRCSSPISADSVFQSSSSSFSRSALARFLRVDASTSSGGGVSGNVGAGRFGGLRPVLVGREVRWVCRAHFDELKSMPTSPAANNAMMK